MNGTRAEVLRCWIEAGRRSRQAALDRGEAPQGEPGLPRLLSEEARTAVLRAMLGTVNPESSRAAPGSVLEDRPGREFTDLPDGQTPRGDVDPAFQRLA